MCRSLRWSLLRSWSSVAVSVAASVLSRRRRLLHRFVIGCHRRSLRRLSSLVAASVVAVGRRRRSSPSVVAVGRRRLRWRNTLGSVSRSVSLSSVADCASKHPASRTNERTAQRKAQESAQKASSATVAKLRSRSLSFVVSSSSSFVVRRSMSSSLLRCGVVVFARRCRSFAAESTVRFANCSFVNCSFVVSLFRCFVVSSLLRRCVRRSLFAPFIRSSVHPFIRSSVHPFIRSSVHPFVVRRSSFVVRRQTTNHRREFQKIAATAVKKLRSPLSFVVAL